MLDQAAMLAGVGPFTAEQKKMMLDGLNDQRSGYDQIRALKIPNSVPHRRLCFIRSRLHQETLRILATGQFLLGAI